MVLSRAFTSAGFRRNKEPKSGDRHVTVTKTMISGPIKLISTTNVMVQQAMADKMASPGSIPYHPALMPITNINPGSLPPRAQITTHGSVRGLGGYDRIQSKENAAHSSMSSSNTNPPSLTDSKSVSSSKTGSMRSNCPSLVMDGSSPKSPARNPLTQYFEAAQNAQGGLPISPAPSHSSSPYSSIHKPAPLNSGSFRGQHPDRNGGMPSIPERALSRSISSRNHSHLGAPVVSPSVCRDSTDMFSNGPPTPTHPEAGLFSEEYEALDEVARDLSDTVKSVQNNVNHNDDYHYSVYGQAEYLALIEPLFQQFIVGSNRY